MTQIIRRAILAFAIMAGFAPAFAQAPPPVPALPDTERRTSYSITSTTCTCAVNFALYGDITDYQNWLEVWLNGVLVNYNDPIYGWTITSPTGPLATIPRPVTNAVLTFNSAQTGTVQIVGARRPRRVSQFAENQGVAARDLNQVLTDIVAQNRETWDKTNDVTGRAIIGVPGDDFSPLPPASTRAGKYLGFDSVTGNPTLFTSQGQGSSGVSSVGITAGLGISLTGTCSSTSLVNCQITTSGMWSVPTVAALRTFPVAGLSNGQVISLTGYTAANDGGGGLFTVSLSNATDDGGCVINSTVGVASFSRINCFQGGSISILYFGGKGDNSTDNTPAFNRMIGTLAAGIGSAAPYGLCGFFPSGTYLFNSQPSDITFNMCLTGVGIGPVSLVRNFSPVNGTDGLFNLKSGSGGSSISRMGIYSAVGTSGGSLIQILATASYAPGFITLSDLDLSTFGSNTHTYTLYVNGSAKTTAPAGVRDLQIRNLQIFGCAATDACAQFISVVGLAWHGGGVFSAGGTGTGTGKILVSGTASVSSQYHNISIETVNGGLNFSNALNVIMNLGQIGATSGVSVSNSNTASYISIHTPQTFGTVQTNWTNSTVGP